MIGESDGEKDTENYFTEIRVDRSHTERIYSFGYGGWFQDEFAGIDARYYLGAGGGYKFFTGPKHYLLGEAGFAYVKEYCIDDTQSDFPVGRMFGKYEYRFTEKSRFTQSLEWIQDVTELDNWSCIRRRLFCPP